MGLGKAGGNAGRCDGSGAYVEGLRDGPELGIDLPKIEILGWEGLTRRLHKEVEEL